MDFASNGFPRIVLEATGGKLWCACMVGLSVRDSMAIVSSSVRSEGMSTSRYSHGHTTVAGEEERRT